MKNLKEFKSRRVPKVVIDQALNKLDKVVLFPSKVEKAKETIARIGLPKK